MPGLRGDRATMRGVQQSAMQRQARDKSAATRGAFKHERVFVGRA